MAQCVFTTAVTQHGMTNKHATMHALTGSSVYSLCSRNTSTAYFMSPVSSPVTHSWALSDRCRQRRRLQPPICSHTHNVFVALRQLSITDNTLHGVPMAMRLQRYRGVGCQALDVALGQPVNLAGRQAPVCHSLCVFRLLLSR